MEQGQQPSMTYFFHFLKMSAPNLFEVKQQFCKKKHFESVFDGLMVEQMFWRQTIKPLRQRTNFFPGWDSNQGHNSNIFRQSENKTRK